jgi:hypothetical protein
MGRVTEAAMLLYPRRRNGDAFSADVPEDDAVAGQRKAANLFLVTRFLNRLVLPLGIIGIVVGALGLALASAPYRSGYLAMILAGAGTLTLALVASRVVARAFVAADDTAGIPVPEDGYDKVCQAHMQWAVVQDTMDEAEFISAELAARLRAAMPRIRQLDAAYMEHLQRMRFSWLAGDVRAWR